MMGEELLLDEEQMISQPQPSEEELQKQCAQLLRRQANIQGGALMIYKLIMNVAVFAVIFVVSFLEAFQLAFSGGLEADLGAITETVMDSAMGAMGWGYLLAVVTGWLILWLWKKNAFFKNEVYRTGKPMRIGSFITLVCLVFGCQLPAQLLTLGLEWICNQFDLSLMQLLEDQAMDMDNLGIWLYVCLAAPVWEEVVFRGLLMRSLEPYGKKLSVIVSAVLFGLYHSSPVQTPYAILVGLILGYVAMEYNVIWAMVLHMMNNLLLSDTLPRLLEGLPYQTGETILWVFLTVCAVVGLILLILRWHEVRTWDQNERIASWQQKAFWRSPCIILLVIWCLLDLGMYFLLLLQ